MNAMIDVEAFLDFLRERSFHFATGVPCSYFSQLIPKLAEHPTFQLVPATREDEAVGIATGLRLGGTKTLLYMQNSGFATTGDALTSLTQLYQVPLLILVSWRGLDVDRDFPEHSIMGEVMEDVLKAYNVPYWILTEDHWRTTLEKALEAMEVRSVPVCLLVKKGVFCE